MKSHFAVSFNQLLAERIVHQLCRTGLIVADDTNNAIEAINIVRYMLDNGVKARPRNKQRGLKGRSR